MGVLNDETVYGYRLPIIYDIVWLGGYVYKAWSEATPHHASCGALGSAEYVLMSTPYRSLRRSRLLSS